jgi:hypothetical protein
MGDIILNFSLHKTGISSKILRNNFRQRQINFFLTTQSPYGVAFFGDYYEGFSGKKTPEFRCDWFES